MRLFSPFRVITKATFLGANRTVCRMNPPRALTATCYETHLSCLHMPKGARLLKQLWYIVSLTFIGFEAADRRREEKSPRPENETFKSENQQGTHPLTPPTHRRVIAGVRPQQVSQQRPFLGLHPPLQRPDVLHGAEARGEAAVHAEQAGSGTPR